MNPTERLENLRKELDGPEPFLPSGMRKIGKALAAATLSAAALVCADQAEAGRAISQPPGIPASFAGHVAFGYPYPRRFIWGTTSYQQVYPWWRRGYDGQARRVYTGGPEPQPAIERHPDAGRPEVSIKIKNKGTVIIEAGCRKPEKPYVDRAEESDALESPQEILDAAIRAVHDAYILKPDVVDLYRVADGSLAHDPDITVYLKDGREVRFNLIGGAGPEGAISLEGIRNVKELQEKVYRPLGLGK